MLTRSIALAAALMQTCRLNFLGGCRVNAWVFYNYQILIAL